MSIRAPSPGRPRGFEIEDAVRRAADIFRLQGFAGTSLVDLLKATGLARGSLYKAFADKHALFLAALDQYIAEAMERLRDRLAQPSARDGIRLTLQYYAGLSSEARGMQGCLINTATAELLPEDPVVRDRVGQYFDRMRALLAETLLRGQAQGEFNPKLDPEAFSRLLLCTIQGMRVLGKTRPIAADMQAIVETALTALR
jgi:TetR/AcrR family transcriptional repressor of nem operon